MAPSIKSLELVFGERAREARDLITGKTSPYMYESVQQWERQCYHRPFLYEAIMCALNEICDGAFGWEAVYYLNDPEKLRAVYLNVGDTYVTTIFYFLNHRQSWKVLSLGDLYE